MSAIPLPMGDEPDPRHTSPSSAAETLRGWMHKSGANQRGVPVDYEEAKRLVRSPVTADRLAVAKDVATPPELLFFLARDKIEDVRAAVAANGATPRKADLMLATDPSRPIRFTVADKVTSQIRSLPEGESAQAWQLTVGVLEALANDDGAEVRRLVAELAARVDRVPGQLAMRLARDAEPSVAGPALEYPGQLDDAELVAIVEEAHDPRIVSAVARRPGLAPQVVDAVVATGDEAAVAVLLANNSARIADGTMEHIIDLAPPIVSWHEPLVQRPALTGEWVRKLASFVGDRLLGFLRGRKDIDQSALPPVVDFVEPTAPERKRPRRPEPDTPEAAAERAHRLHALDELDEECMNEALEGESAFLIAALSLRAKEPPGVVQKILSSKSGKALVSLAWKAALSPHFGLALQMRARIPPKSRLAGSGDSWPLTPEEMAWQVDFFSSLSI